jgi:hypothetical protein
VLDSCLRRNDKGGLEGAKRGLRGKWEGVSREGLSPPGGWG